MQALLKAMLEDNAILEMAKNYQRTRGSYFVYGMAGTAKHAALASCYQREAKAVVIITHNQQELSEWKEDLQELLPQSEIMELPVLDMADFTAAAKGLQRMAMRMKVLGKLLSGEPVIVLATVQAAVQKGISKAAYQRLQLQLQVGTVIQREELLDKLVKLGYERTDQVEMAGDFSVRGGLVDVFPLNSSEPYRIEFFDDEIDTIRQFNLATQLSVNKVDAITIMPFGGVAEKSHNKMFVDFLPEKSCVFLDEPLKTREECLRLFKENPEDKGKLFSWEEVLAELGKFNLFYLALLLHNLHNDGLSQIISVKVSGAASYQKQMDMLASDVQDWLATSQKVLVTLGDNIKRASMRETLAKHSLPAVEGDIRDDLKPGRVTLVQGALLNGFELPGAGLVLLTEKDILGRQKKRLSRVSKDERISHFREINVGDYVVHSEHGIGKYLGVETIEIEGIKRDYLNIQYGGEDRLHVPTDQVGLLQKYIGSEGEVPRLHRMGSASWAKTKAKAKKAAEDIAEELIKLYATRKKTEGFAYGEDTVWQQEFEEAFPYEETPDQLAAIEDIKKDMESSQPMDRLLCGDVGFGKTEVAVRAAFKAVMGGKQVAVLVPTTVLAQQHYQTFEERFRNFAVTIDVLNRFRTSKEQKNTLDRTAEGQVDILIGTHALLNQNRVKFKNLGLLIVDEEQRVGVKQKEKIKHIAVGIDVLTLSATPIPRTLHMSLAGARDISIIESAPQERFPVQTYVVENSNNIIRNAVHREMKRGGQVYFVYNRVDSIEQMRYHLEQIIPDAVVGIAHGQMPEAQLERVMVEFYEGKYDILLATSIIESGLNILNANTIIIYDADKFGLAQLYQMRGRVGRSHNLAYAYLLYRENKVLSEVAEKRLQAIKEFAELGAGFKIAMRDLEIRGAGNLLGSQQHGHIASVGFEMYCRLIEDAMQSIKTGKPVEVIPEPVIKLQVEAYLDGDYIGDAMHKIEIYQRIAAVRTNKQLDKITDELIDRFGEPTPQVERLLDIARIRNFARDISVEKIVQGPLFLEIYFQKKPKVKTENIMAVLAKLGKGVRMMPDTMMMRIDLKKLKKQPIHKFVLQLLQDLAAA